jgi:hypothetical protein
VFVFQGTLESKSSDWLILYTILIGVNSHQADLVRLGIDKYFVLDWSLG